MKMIRRVAVALMIWAFLLGGIACKKGGDDESPPSSTIPAQVEAHREKIDKAIESNLKLFLDQCRDIEHQEDFLIGPPHLARTGPILVARTDGWKPSSTEKPRFQYEEFADAAGEEPKCLALVYTESRVMRSGENRGKSGRKSDDRVDWVRKISLVHLIDLQEGTYLGTEYVMGPEPTESAPSGDEPELSILLQGPVLDVEAVAVKVNDLALAMKSGDKEKVHTLLSTMPAKDTVESTLFLCWSREEALGQIPEEFKVSLEYSHNSEKGLEYHLNLKGPEASSDKAPPPFSLRLYFDKDHTLYRIDNVATVEELKSYVDLIAASKGSKLETPSTVLNIVETVVEEGGSDKALTICAALLAKKFGPLDEELKKKVVVLEQRLQRERAQAHSGEIKSLKSDALGFLRTGKYDDAILALKKAAKLDPNDDEIDFLIIRSYDEKNDLKTALTRVDAFSKRFPQSSYSSRLADIKSALRKKQVRLKEGGDVTARFRVTGKPIVSTDSYTSFYPSDSSVLDRQTVNEMRGGRGHNSYKYQRPDLYRDTELKLLKTASYKEQPAAYYNNQTHRSYRVGRDEVIDAAYIEVLSGELKGSRGWLQLRLMNYRDIGAASEPFNLPLIFPE